jgi:uncharacterized iron-regulated membrane protein
MAEQRLTVWQQWRDRPEHLWFRRAVFQIHLWFGAAVGAYIFLMSVSGSLLVFQRTLAGRFSVQWLVDLHTNLLAGRGGRLVNGIGALSLLLLCVTGAVICWPGIAHWRRSLTVERGARFPRLNWDLHSALGFWCFGFVAMWGLSAVYFVFPRWFDALLLFDSADRVTDRALFWLAELHFGRFSILTQAIWALVGLVPAALSFTGIFICCRRVIYGKASNPKHATG